MLVGLSGYLAGYNGSFEFKSGEEYPPELNYVFMRIFNAVFGILCVPLIFYTAKTLKFSNQAVYLVTLMALCGKIPLCVIDGRKLLRDHQQVHPAGFDVTVFYGYDDVLSRQVPQLSQPRILPRVVDLACQHRGFYWLRVQVPLPECIYLTSV